MQTNYSEQDTERARQAERAAAEQLQVPGGYGPVGLAASPARPNGAALLLIGLGVLLLAVRGMSVPLEFTGGLVLLTIASCFYFFGLWKRIYGLIIPASILAGLSIGFTFADLTNGVSVLWGLALGFLGIFAIGRGMFGVRSAWPIYPAVPLFAVGVIVAVASLPGLLSIAMIWGPMLLIGAGLYLGWVRR
jgi:uncharacterized membrane protein